jgi:hypothetical protein
LQIWFVRDDADVDGDLFLAAEASNLSRLRLQQANLDVRRHLGLRRGRSCRGHLETPGSFTNR